MSLDKQTVKYDNEGNKWVLAERVFKMYDAVEVAWRMLISAKNKGIPLTNLKLQKLVYIAHGYFLGWKSEPLVKDPVEAWKYGPVIGSIYRQFKDGNSTIEVSDTSMKTELDSDVDANTTIDRVLDMYREFTAKELVDITHQKDTPWDRSWNNTFSLINRGKIIDNNDIKNHYRDVINNPEKVTGL